MSIHDTNHLSYIGLRDCWSQKQNKNNKTKTEQITKLDQNKNQKKKNTKVKQNKNKNLLKKQRKNIYIQKIKIHKMFISLCSWQCMCMKET